MRTLLALLTSLTLTGCGTYGEPLLLANIFDANDPCQRASMPSWCGAGQGVTITTLDYRTGRYISTTQVR